MGNAEVQVKTYKNGKEYERDAPKMARSGWVPQGQSGAQGKVNMGRTVVKAGLFLPWALMRPSRKGTKITVTWVKTPADPQPMTGMIPQAAGSSAPVPAAASEGIPEKLKQLGELRDAGILNAEEFDLKKADLLSRL